MRNPRKRENLSNLGPTAKILERQVTVWGKTNKGVKSKKVENCKI